MAMITSASITAPGFWPLQESIRCWPPRRPRWGADDGLLPTSTTPTYWVVNRMLGIDEVKDQIRVWSVPTTHRLGPRARFSPPLLSFVVPAS